MIYFELKRTEHKLTINMVVLQIYQIGRVRWQAMQARKQANQARARRLRKRSFDDSMPKSSRLIKHRMMVSRPGSQHD